MPRMPKKDKFPVRTVVMEISVLAGRIDSDKKSPNSPEIRKWAFIAFANGVRTRNSKEFIYGG